MQPRASGLRSKALGRQFLHFAVGRTLPLQVNVPPAEQKWVSAWTISQEYMESSPSCLRIDEEISPNYRVCYTMRSEKGSTPVPTTLGRNDDFSTIFAILKSTVMHPFGSHLAHAPSET